MLEETRLIIFRLKACAVVSTLNKNICGYSHHKLSKADTRKHDDDK